MFTLFVVEGVAEPYSEASVILRENLRHIIVRDKLLFVELRKYSFGEGFLDWFKGKLREAREYAVLPESVRKESVKVGVIV